MSEMDEAEKPNWRPLSEFEPRTFAEHYVALLYGFPDGDRVVAGMYREGPFFGKQVTGWFAPERIDDFGRPEHGMWIDGAIKGWLPYINRPAKTDAALKG